MDEPPPAPHEAFVLRTDAAGRPTLRRIDLRARVAILCAIIGAMLGANAVLWANLPAPGP